MMNENVEKWVAALKSGDYDQTQGTLEDSKGFCCLGVGIKVWEEETGKAWDKTEEGRLKGDTLADYQGPEVMEWYGLTDDQGDHTYGEPSLVDLNDESRLSFRKIANKIVEYHEALFPESEEEE